ncbi:hypothetical protein [Rossellomorea sp. NS-SX7]|uniref:hypothetical protein n=1 Tax=Rossellomorea sp. NS-SX7 TaxID=3463856 RepID=UPI00405908B6
MGGLLSNIGIYYQKWEVYYQISGFIIKNEGFIIKNQFLLSKPPYAAIMKALDVFKVDGRSFPFHAKVVITKKPEITPISGSSV